MEENEVLEKLKKTYNLNNDISKWLYRTYKEKAFDLMDKRPYILGHYKEVNVKKALKVIYDLSNDDLEINEMAFYILYIFNEASKNGGLMSISWTQKVKLFYAVLLANNSHCSGVM